MMAVEHTKQLGYRIAKILGLPEKTKGFELTLRCYVDEYVTVKCEYFTTIDDDRQAELESMLAEYELVEKPKNVDTM